MMCRSRWSAERRCFIVAALAFWVATALAEQRFTGKVVGITDGDTIAVMRGGRPLTVRLEGIDCPENAQDFSQRAKQFTSKMAFAKTANVEVRDVDRYGRLVARVYVDEKDVSLALVTAGLAWHRKQYSADPKLALAEVQARAARVGLWSHPTPIPPWEFRRPVPVERALSAADPEGPYHGNLRSHVFHRPGCSNYSCKNCTAVFQARREAVAAGFRPARDCLK